jgi:hypothetical protein
VALAVAYHLARPGSEIDQVTMQDYHHGLGEVLPVIEDQFDDPKPTFDLNPLQASLLSTAFSSVMSELKMYSIFDTMSGDSARPRSTASGFDDKLRALFPEIVEDPSLAMGLAEDLAMLRRELPFARAKEALEEQRVAAEEAQRKHRKPWEFWKR